MSFWSDLTFTVFEKALDKAVSHFPVSTEKREISPMARILNFGKPHPVFLVLGHREDAPDGILPRVATEDFMAFYNITMACVLARLPRPPRMKDADGFMADESNMNSNIVVIGGCKANGLQERLQKDASKRGIKIPLFAKDEETGSEREEWFFTHNKQDYKSPSYGQERQLSADGISVTDMKKMRDKELEDKAFIFKTTNWTPMEKEKKNQTKLLVVAGIRGFGTWGAAEYVRKNSERLFQDNESRDFMLPLSVTYRNRNIMQITPLP